MKLEQVACIFLRHVKISLSPRTYALYSQRIGLFIERYGTLEPAQLKLYQVDEWLSTMHSWAFATRNQARGAVRTMLRWAVDNEVIEPVSIAQRLHAKPTPSRGGWPTITEEQYLLLAAHTKPDFRDFLFACWSTGMRPSTIAGLEARHYQPETQRLTTEKHKTSRSGKPVVVRLATSEMIALIERLVAKNPQGALFRTASGKEWTAGLWCKIMARLRAQLHLPKHVYLGRCRPSVATRLIKRGHSYPIVAKILQCTVKTLQHHYDCLGEDEALITEALASVNLRK